MVRLKHIDFEEKEKENIEYNKRKKVKRKTNTSLNSDLKSSFEDHEIKIVNISKSFGRQKVLDKINFHVKKNEILGLIGKSGAGKSTILKILVGFYEPDSGSIIFNGKKYSHYNKKEFLKKIGFVSQENRFYDELTVFENLEYFGSLYDLSDNVIKHNADQLLKFLNLESKKNVLSKKLSGGMRRRLDFACAMIHNPEILIMDEPTTGFDPVLREHFLKIIKAIKNMGKTIIFSSHLFSDLEEVADKVAILNDKKIVAFDSIENLKKVFLKSYEVHLEVQSKNYSRILRYLKKLISIDKYRIEKGRLIISTNDPLKVLKAEIPLVEKLNEKIVDFDFEKPTLNDIFEYFVLKK